MIKIWQLLLSGILILSGTISIEKTSEIISLYQSFNAGKGALYKNVNQAFEDNQANFNPLEIWVNNTRIGNTTNVFKWKEYANTWEDFQSNYGSLNLKIDMKIAYNKANKWNADSLSISLKNISSNETWVRIAKLDEVTTQPSRWDATHGELLYAIWISGDYVKLHFKFHTWASNDYDCYYFTIITRQVVCNSTFDYNTIFSKLNQGLNNRTLSLKSDYSTSLQDERNIPIENAALDQLIANVLGDYYTTWKPFIGEYAYDDQTNQATITVKFNDPNTNEAIFWEFKVTIKFTLSQEYWDREFSKRLDIIPGKVIDPTNPNGAMIEDKPLKWNGKDVYSTTATVRFAGAADGSETMKVNGVPIHVIDNTFTFEMTDRQNKDEEGKLVNEYDILLEKHDLDDFNKVIGKYEVNYLIKQEVPNLDLKWYAWNPSANPDQRKLVEPTLPNGDPNPNYDKEVNRVTGTKTQIVWINHKAENPFPLDPLNKNGDIIKDNIYDEGFLAEGSVSGMGIAQLFTDKWIKSVQRAKVDPTSLKPIENFKQIKPDNDGSYWSESGIYLYVLTDQKGHTSNKFIIIGQQWQEKYAKFLDVLTNPDIAVPFWSTLHGFHLKNYLAKYKELNSKDIQNLAFEQVASYWKEYVSALKSQHIGPDIDPGDNFDLGEMRFETIKMNKDSIETIKQEIIKQVEEQLAGNDLEYDVDYELKPFDKETLQRLLNYDDRGNATITININALPISTKLIGTNKIKIINNIHYDPDKVIDLKSIKFRTWRYNFSEFTVDKLKEWVFKDINLTFDTYKITLDYPDDYGVEPLDEPTLEQFLRNKDVVSQIFTIFSQDDSIKTKNSTTLELINDPSAPPAPPDPDPDPNPDPDPDIPDHKSWISKPANLIIMTIITTFVVATIGITFFLRHRFKKGIGGKKNKKKYSQQRQSKKRKQ